MTVLTAGALTDPQLPAIASNVCTIDARPGGVGRVPSPTKILATPVTQLLYTNLTLIVCYAPIDDAMGEDNDIFYEQLQAATQEVKPATC